MSGNGLRTRTTTYHTKENGGTWVLTRTTRTTRTTRLYFPRENRGSRVVHGGGGRCVWYMVVHVVRSPGSR